MYTGRTTGTAAPLLFCWKFLLQFLVNMAGGRTWLVTVTTCGKFLAEKPSLKLIKEKKGFGRMGVLEPYLLFFSYVEMYRLGLN